MKINMYNKNIIIFILLLLIPLCSFAEVDSCVYPHHLRTIRPNVDVAPTDIKIGLAILDIKKIDTEQQEFEVDFIVSQIWQDERLIPYLENNCDFDIHNIWNPQIYVFNDVSLQKKLNERIKISSEGEVFYRQRLQGRVSSPLNLQKFPFDHQVLPITLLSFTYGPEDINLVLNKEKTAIVKSLSLPGWALQSIDTAINIFEVDVNDIYLTRVQFDYILTMERLTFNYVLKQGVPLLFIVFMSWAVFWISPKELPSQIGLVSVSMLTLIAYMFALSRSLPPVAYFTRMDFFTINAIILVFLAFIEAIMTSRLVAKGQEEKAIKLDRICRIVFPLSLIVMTVFAFIQ